MMETQPGWYQSPDDLNGLLRWWNGEIWTSYTQAASFSTDRDTTAAIVAEIRRQGALERRAARNRQKYVLTLFWVVVALVVFVLLIRALARATS